MDIRFSIDDCLPFGFDTGGAVPQQGSSAPVPVSALIMANTTAPPIFGNLEVLEQEEE